MYGKILPELRASPMDYVKYASMFSAVTERVSRIGAKNKSLSFRFLNRPKSGLATIDSFRVLAIGLSEADLPQIKAAFKQGATEPDVIHRSDLRMFSLKFNEIQVDLEMVDTPSYPMTYMYRSYNNIGIILDNILKPLGLYLSDEGLCVNIPKDVSNEEEDMEMILTSASPEIARALGIPSSAFQYDKASMSEVLDNLVISPYVSLDTFKLTEQQALDNPDLNASILEYFNSETASGRTNIGYIDKRSMRVTEEVISTKTKIRYAIRFFGAEERYKSKIKGIRVHRNYTSLLKGEVISELIGKALGEEEVQNFLNYYRQSRKNIRAWMVSKTQTEVKEDIKAAYELFKSLTKVVASSPKTCKVTPEETTPTPTGYKF